METRSDWMRLFNDDQEMMRYLKSRLIISGFTVTLIFLLFNLGTIYEIISQFIGLFKYLFIGTVIAYILNQPMKLIESQIIKRCKTNSFWYQKKRGLSIFITLILFLCLVITIASIIIPNIIDSLILLMSNISYFVKSVFYNIDRMLLYFKIDFKTTDITSINEFMNMPWQNVVKGVLDFLTKNADSING